VYNQPTAEIREMQPFGAQSAHQCPAQAALATKANNQTKASPRQNKKYKQMTRNAIDCTAMAALCRSSGQCAIVYLFLCLNLIGFLFKLLWVWAASLEFPQSIVGFVPPPLGSYNLRLIAVYKIGKRK